MPELKNLFIKGKMNKDLDERLVPQGEYRDAQNIDVAFSEGSNVGAIEPIMGHTGQGGYFYNLTDAHCVGSVTDTENDKAYALVYSPSINIIVEYDIIANTKQIVLADEGSILDFSPDRLITGIAVLDGVLYYTDDHTEPKQIDIEYWKGKSNLTATVISGAGGQNTITLSSDISSELNDLIAGGDVYFFGVGGVPQHIKATSASGATVTLSANLTGSGIVANTTVIFSILYTTENLSEDRISLYKKGPLNAPTFHTLSASTRGGVGALGNLTEIETTVIPNLSTTAIDTSISITFSVAPNYLVDDIIILKRNITVGQSTESSSARVKITAKPSLTQFTCTLLAKTDNVEDAINISYIPLLEEDEPLFELKFPRFSYRYKYTNGQYSTFAPFSVPAFLPGDFEYDAKKAYNLGMENTVRSLKLQGWITTPNAATYEADIEEIDILYKDSVSPNVYIVESIKKSGGSFASPFEIKDEQIFKATQSNQLLRPFDSIPRKAKALEITGNRLIFGNYLQNFDYTDTPSFTIDTVPRTNSTELAQKLGLKTRRTYQFGIGFQDKYGRQTPVFTDTSGVKKITQENADFNLQFKVATSTTPPSEATHYKYYIKETSNEYYNFIISNIYDDEEGFLYLSIPSAETNKINVDDFIILKKETGGVSYKGAEKKFKVIDKLNDPPNFLAKKDDIIYSATIFTFDKEFFEDSAAEFKTPGITPVEGHNTITIGDAYAVDDPATGVVTTTFKATMTVGSVVRFRRRGTAITSKKYTIESVQPTVISGGNAGMEMTFEQPFGDDVNALYSTNKEAAALLRDEIYLEKVDEKDDTGNPEYEGKFFIKLNNSVELKNALETTFDESLLKTISSHSLFTKQYSAADRGYYIWDAAPGGVYANGNILENVPNLNGISIPDGFHVIIQTQEYYNDSHSFYSTDPWNLGLIAGNYVRFSGGNQRRLTASDDFTALYETNTTTSAASNNSKNITVSSASGIEIGDKVTAAAPFEQVQTVTVVAISGNTITLSSPQTITSGANVRFIKSLESHPNYKIKEVIFIPGTGAHGYWVLKFENPLEVTLPVLDNATNDNRWIAVETRTFDPTKLGSFTNPPVFEVEPEEGVLDIYYETEKTFPVSDLTSPIVSRTIPWSNCISFGNGVESDRIRDDFNAPTIGKGVRVSTVFEDNYKEERVKSGLIFSGLYNGKNGINRLNQFIIAENITEEANPIYGSIQKLNTRDTDLTLLCDDKILKVPARKDLLFQADGNPQVTSTDRFLGTIIPYAGNYGCQHPESFADYTYKSYFVDKSRGKVLRLSLDGLTEISNYGMRDYINDICLSHNGYIHGSFDSYKNQYNVSFRVGSGLDGSAADKTITFSESVNGWVSFKDYIQESGFSLNNRYVTFKDGNAYRHHNSGASGLHGTAYKSSVTLLLNGNPGNIKNFRTLNYQGESGWRATTITTDKQSGNISNFVEKEGIYYNYISGETQATKASLDLKALNVQGLGTPTSISSNDATFVDLNNAIQVGDKVFNNNNSDIRTVQSISGNTITLDAPPTNAFSYFAKDNRFNTSGILGYYAEIKMETTNNVVFGNRPELYSVGSEVSLSS